MIIPDPTNVPLGTRNVPLPVTVPSPVRMVVGDWEKNVLWVALHVPFPGHTHRHLKKLYTQHQSKGFGCRVASFKCRRSQRRLLFGRHANPLLGPPPEYVPSVTLMRPYPLKVPLLI